MTTPSGPRVQIRPRASDDLPAAAAALVQVHHSDGYPVEGVDDPAAWLTSPHQIAAWVAELDDHIVGHAALGEPQPDDAAATLWAEHDEGHRDHVAVLGRLFVLHEARGHALGEQLVRTATASAHEHRRRLVPAVLTQDAAAIRLYERLGWQRIGTTQHHYGHGRTI